MRRVFLLLILPLVLAGCGENREEAITPTGMNQGGPPETLAEGTFQPGGDTAVTYDPEVVPAGGTAQVAVARSARGTTVRVSVTGLRPGRAYGAHLHTEPCAAKPDAAGPHYQHDAGPRASASAHSADPAYVNPDNEVWLDFTTDAQGAASATSAQNWTFDERHPPRSLILHAARTRTAAGAAGTAGPRVACLTLPAG